MAVRIRKDGTIVCAAIHPEQPKDAYLDDGVHYELSVIHKVLVTELEPKHSEHGLWWWKGQEPTWANINPFYYVRH